MRTARAVANKPGPRPPYQELNVTARKKGRNRAYAPSSECSRSRMTVMTATDNAATP
jgi:hypothetical protein